MRKILITITVIALILSIVGTGVIVSLEMLQPTPSSDMVSAE